MFNFKSSDNKTTIQAAVWKAESKPIGVIQLVHGITEYMGRYDKVAQYFTSKGYVVCGIDIIGTRPLTTEWQQESISWQERKLGICG